jgi:hypothetical protein
MPKFLYPNDPSDAVCPYCDKSDKPCSHVDSMARAYARDACKKKNVKEDTSHS